MLIAHHLARALQSGMTLPALLESNAPHSREGMSFIDRDGSIRSLPYPALCGYAKQGAARLIQAGVRAGDPVIICCDDECNLVQAFWAVLYAGGVAVPLSAPTGYVHDDEGLKKILSVAGQCTSHSGAAPLLISDLDMEALNRIAAWRDAISADRLITPQALFGAPTATANAIAPVERASDELAMLMFSSGSTGDPKGVRLSHRQLLTNMMQICERSGVSSADRSLSWLPLTHDMGLVLFHLCHTLAGIAQYKTTPLTFARDPAAFLDHVGALAITLLGMPNFGFDQLLRIAEGASDGRWQLASVRVIYNGAEPIDPQLCRRFTGRFGHFGMAPGVISPGWGIAEASVAATAFPQAQLVALGQFPVLWVDADCLIATGMPITIAMPRAPGAREIAALGPAMTGMVLRVLDDEGCELPPSHLGHLEFSGPNVSPGYFGQADSAWCASGDIGFVHDGIVYLTGRAKDVLFINGRNHYSNDLELALCRLLDWPANQLAVVGFTDPQGRRERVVVFFRAMRGMDKATQSEQLRSALESLLAYPVAGAIAVATLPKTTSGKIRRFALRQALARGDYDLALAQTGQVAQCQLTATEAMLLEIVRGIVTDLPAAINPVLPLSRYGLDSVGFMQLAFRAGTAAGRDLQPHLLLKAATLARIAAEVDAATDSTSTPLALSHRVPLSARQTMLWTAWLIAPDSAVYNETYWIKLGGALDPQAWIDAAREVVACHAILNSVVDDGATPGLVIRAAPSVDIALDQGPATGYQDAAALAMMEALGARPFDLRRGPLLRLRLIRAASGHWYLFLSAHHIVVDGWSLQLLISQIFCASTGGAVPARENGLEFQPQAFDAIHIQQWQERISAAEPIQLPSELASVSHGATVVHRQTLSQTSCRALLAWQSDGGASQFSVVAGALLVLLARLASVRRPLLATVASGRAGMMAEHRIGYYALTLPLTVDIDPAAGFDTVLAQVEQQRLAILSGETPDLPALERNTGSVIAESIRVVYVYQNMPALKLSGGVTVDQQGQLRGAARADLYVNSSWHNGQLILDWEYDSGRLGAAQIAGYAELFEHALTSLLAAPARALVELDLLSPLQRALWRPYQDTACQVDFGQSVLTRFACSVQLWPDLIAVSDSVARYSYAQLGQKVDALCHLVEQAGLSQGDRVCLLTERSAEYVMALIACLKVGAVVVPIDPALPQERIMQIASDSGATILLTTPGVSLPPALSAAHRGVCFGADTLAAGPAYMGPSLNPSDPAYLIFTSGSTGGSKGVQNTHRCLTNLVDWVCRAFSYRAGETICQFAPFSFDVSIAEILPSLCAGLHIHVLPVDRRNSPELYLETIAQQRINIATVTPAYFALLNELPQRCRDTLASLRLMILGGEALKTEEVARFRQHSPQVELVNVYGPTETTVLSTAYPVPQQLDLARPWQPLGLPIANTEVWLLDENDRVCPATLTGTLYIAGDGLGCGYWQDPHKTAAAFRMLAPGGGPARLFYCSGDLARLTSGGLLEFVGRSDNQIKLRGFRIELGEIESTLERHALIDAAVVKAISREGAERVLVAYYSGKRLDRKQLDDCLRASLPSYMVPSFYQHVQTWPLTTNRKVDRQCLSEPDWLADADTLDKVAPEGPTEQTLANIWQEVLGLTFLGRDDNFFLLGGSSLGAVRLVNRVREQFGRALALSAVMQNPTLAAMARQIELAAVEQASLLEHRGPRDAEALATEAQARQFFLERSHPGKAMNNIPLTLALQGPLDSGRLRDAVLALAIRHAMLRARFRLDAQGLTLCFDASVDQQFTAIIAATTALAIEDLRCFHCRPFDMELGPLWRIAHIRASDSGDQWLALSLHHAIADGVTLMRWLAELDALYQGQVLPSIEAELTYQDYGLWLSVQLAGEFGARATGFWSESARRAVLPPLPLRDVHHDDVQGRELVVSLDARQTALLQSVCRETSATPFVLMLSLFGLVIGQRLQTGRFMLGVTLNGRARLDFERVPGLFVNTLPLAFEWHKNDYLADLTAHIKQSLAQLQEVEEYPLNRVMSVLGQRDMPFNILFNEEVLPPEFSFGGRPAALEPIGTGTAKFPMLVSFLLNETRWRWRMECRANELDKGWVDGLVEDVKNLIDSLDGMSGATLGELESLDGDLLALLELN
jgi:amino acid adenylation domain-containing protein